MGRWRTSRWVGSWLGGSGPADRSVVGGQRVGRGPVGGSIVGGRWPVGGFVIRRNKVS